MRGRRDPGVGRRPGEHLHLDRGFEPSPGVPPVGEWSTPSLRPRSPRHRVVTSRRHVQPSEPPTCPAIMRSPRSGRPMSGRALPLPPPGSSPTSPRRAPPAARSHTRPHPRTIEDPLFGSERHVLPSPRTSSRRRPSITSRWCRAGHPPSPGAAHEGDDVLEETPEFLQDTPDHDRLWFEQRPPRDFDFDSEPSVSRHSATARLDPLGAIAQLGERLLCKQEVAGSIPAGSTSRNPRKSGGFRVVVDRKLERVYGARGHGGGIRSTRRTVRPDSSKRTLRLRGRG